MLGCIRESQSLVQNEVARLVVIPFTNIIAWFISNMYVEIILIRTKEGNSIMPFYSLELICKIQIP